MSPDDLSADEANKNALITLPIRNLRRRRSSSSDVGMDAPVHNGKRIRISLGSSKKVKTEKTSNINTELGLASSAVSKAQADSDDRDEPHPLYDPATEYEVLFPRFTATLTTRRLPSLQAQGPGVCQRGDWPHRGRHHQPRDGPHK